jgi:iron complex outermembrane receptor protein
MLVINVALIAQNADSCTYEMKGIILDADTEEVLQYVAVNIKGTQHFSLTDTNGEFHIKKLCNSSNTLIISCLGYCDTTCQHFYEYNQRPFIYLKKEKNYLETINITAARTKEAGTASISQRSLNKEVLSLNPTQSLAAALSEVEGVTFTSTGNNVQLPVIHGLYGNRVLILNNGIKHGFQNWGSDHAPEIDISTANRVTVLKGAAGVRYGPEALGGAIIVDANPLLLTQPFKAKIGTGYQTNGKGYFANSEISQGLDKWSYHLGVNYNRIGDRQTPDYSLTNTGKEERAINGGLGYHLKDLDFKIYYSYLNQNLGLLRSSIADSGTAFVRAINSDKPIIINEFSYDINQPSQLVQHHLGKVEVDWRYTDDAKLTLRIGSQLNKREEYDVRRNAELPIFDLDLITNDFQLDWKHPDWFQLNGLVGLQVFTQNNDNNPGTQTTPFIPNYNTFRFSAFAIESYKKSKNTFELGIRLDHEYNNVRGRETSQNIFRDNYNFTNLTASLGYIRQISNNTTFRTNLGTAWRTPNVAELYSFGQRGFKSSFGLLRYYFSDENEIGKLKTDKVIALEESNVVPEIGYKFINEWRTQKKTNTYTFTAYTHYIQNFIFERPLAIIGTIRGPMPVFINDQADALFVGTDFSWQKEWSNSVNGTLGMSYLLPMNIDKKESLINQPPITMNYQLVWKMPTLWKSTSSQLSLKPSYTFNQFQAPRTIRPEDLIDGSVIITPDSEVFDFKDAPSGYFLFDIAWQLKSDRFNVGLSIQNVFNTRYRNYLNEMRYFADEPGINFLLSINYFLKSKSN